ncbi:hypothetical protein [Natronococcus sp.]|uniref:hypothetical protein n=1 Tax=Natronococcus sp. TaxID=35747 RepID=UPI003A4DECBA
MSRHQYLAVEATVGATAVDGCSTAADFLAGTVLEAVTGLNGAERHLAGSIEVADPDGSPVLEDRFDLAADDDDGADEDAQATSDDVLMDSGEYSVTLELDEEDALEDDRVIEELSDLEDLDDEFRIRFVATSLSASTK